MLDVVLEVAQGADVAQDRSARHLQSLGELGEGPVGAPAHQPQKMLPSVSGSHSVRKVAEIGDSSWHRFVVRSPQEVHDADAGHEAA